MSWAAIWDILLWGLLASLAMTLVIEGGRAIGLTRMSLPLLLGTWFSGERARAHQVGIAVYFLGGWVISFCYAAVFQAIGGACVWAGSLLGLAHGVLLILALSHLPYVHPRIASEYLGVRERNVIEPPGMVGLNYGFATPLLTVVAQALYGLVLGAGLAF